MRPRFSRCNVVCVGVIFNVNAVMGLFTRALAQSAAAGALPVLYAATAPGVEPDSFTGPRLLGWRGAPAPSKRAAWTLDDRSAALLWAFSQTLTGVTYEGL